MTVHPGPPDPGSVRPGPVRHGPCDPAPVLVLVAHGTRAARGRRQIGALTAAVARRRRGIDVRLAFVDVQRPRLAEVLAGLGRPAVVVPLLLSSGYHVRVDIADAVAGTGAVTTDPIGPDPGIVELLAGRIAGAGAADAVVLAAAGSRDPRSRADVRAVAAALPMPVHVGYVSGTRPRVPCLVARLRLAGARRVTVAAYLLAGGLFHASLHRSGAAAVTEPLGTASSVADLVWCRFDGAAPRLAVGRQPRADDDGGAADRTRVSCASPGR